MNFAAIYFATVFGLLFDPFGGLVMIAGALVMKTRQGVLIWAGFSALALNLFLAPKIGLVPLNAGQVAFTTVLLLILRFTALAIQGLIAQAVVRWIRQRKQPSAEIEKPSSGAPEEGS